MRVKDYIAIGCIALSLLVCSFILGRATAPKSIVEGEKTVDTVTKYVPMWKDFPQPTKTVQMGSIAVPKYLFLADSVDRLVPYAVHDTTTQYVYLPREQKYYEEADGHLRLWVSGYEPRLDRWEADFKETVVSEIYKPPSKRWGLGLSGGYALALVNGKLVPAPYIGACITYSFLQW